MPEAWRSRLRFHEPWPPHHPHHCYNLYLVRLFWLIILAFFFMEVAGVEGRVSSKGCLQRERDALLLFKSAIKDPSARLSSWHAQVDCCAWTGVVCHNRTGSIRVAELNLQNPNAYQYQLNESDTALRGELLHPSLLSLTHLHTLNLSFNDFDGTQIPPLIGSLHKLLHLDLSFSNFSGTIPPRLGNLTNLLYLDLRSYNYPYSVTLVHSLDWLSGLSSLIYLDMSYMNLSIASHNLISAVNMLPSLQQLNVAGCGINNIPLSLSFHLNLTSLTTLDLSENFFNSSFPNWLWNLTSLSSLTLSMCEIRGMLPIEIGNLISLTHLDLDWNLLSGPLPDTLWKLKHLTYLLLGFNFLGNSLPMGIMNLSSLSTLFLDNCSLTGPIPSELGNLTTLNTLSLESNLLSGLIPHEIGKLVNLEYLDLSINSFEGDITEFHLSNLTKLNTLFLSGITIAIDHNWNPPFQLQVIRLGSCKLGPRLPTWLRSQKSIMAIVLHNTSIEDNLPEWFWNSLSIVVFLDLSHNKISGTLPASLENLTKLSYLYLHSNLLEGPIPHLPPNLLFLDLSLNAFSGPLSPTLFTPNLYCLLLSHNHIIGSIPSNVCNCHSLERLDLSNNKLSGEIPQCWQEGTRLQRILLASNMLFGKIPSSLGNLMELVFLHLNNNSLIGHLPSSLQNCKQLVIVDFGDNKLSGKIPLWIGQSWQQLRILRLSSNIFHGNIDPQLGHLRYLQIIDLANNTLSGSIPHPFGNFSTMVSTSAKQLPNPGNISGAFIEDLSDEEMESITLVTKGDKLTFSSILYLVKSIDLSKNDLTDEIPEELGHLVELNTLNLSRNHFKGKIPDSIGRMSSLETLDLSFNNLSGDIPQGLSQLNALNHLNLSYNNLSGNIPSGNQLQTLDDASIYIGNLYLCGDLYYGGKKMNMFALSVPVNPSQDQYGGGPKEALWTYIKRFNQVVMDILSVSSEILVNVFAHELTKGEFFRSLIQRPPNDVDHLLRKATVYINVEEAQAERKKEVSIEPAGAPERRPPSSHQPPKGLRAGREQ
ncbi:receptor-like protein EIX1 [Zingiber officinale]|uniref:receptor-like protein EIX1 n=1 Tax=Zingiber officinale TaxID=94328 RepID=UPI001C4A7F7A|nr:receptor-like protein EIX1 [Zingiber officinale]